tara:strand:+ start:231 stop:488 length:258 start_codon:yes stop_codon:yes gene_type:complete
MSMEPQELGWLENQYEEALEEYHRLLTENLGAMKIVELDEDEDRKINFINKNLQQALWHVGLDDEDLSASYEDGLEIFDQVYQNV